MKEALYKTFSLVKRFSKRLSVRTFQGRYFLVDDENDTKIAEAIQGTSVKIAKYDTRTWAHDRLLRRINAIDTEMMKYEDRITVLQDERKRLENLYSDLQYTPLT